MFIHINFIQDVHHFFLQLSAPLPRQRRLDAIDAADGVLDGAYYGAPVVGSTRCGVTAQRKVSHAAITVWTLRLCPKEAQNLACPLIFSLVRVEMQLVLPVCDSWSQPTNNSMYVSKCDGCFSTRVPQNYSRNSKFAGSFKP